MATFDQLWEEAEKTLQEETAMSLSSQELIKELIAKLNLYEKFNSLEMDPADKATLLTNAMGKALLVLTQISFKDNINTYAALKAALDDKKVEIFTERYK